MEEYKRRIHILTSVSDFVLVYKAFPSKTIRDRKFMTDFVSMNWIFSKVQLDKKKCLARVSDVQET